ncbi:MAG TPA: urea carboxylase-associated family protein [Methylomirabilota bacterium]|jgi:uncharacterized protein YcgI (DUF1989 family)|nr:urea carboxylase-associated family protein [Methylomirabilota bacterium]
MGHPARAEALKVDREVRIPAGTGAGLRVAAGEYVQIVDVEGRGCADFFALAAANPSEYLSASHTRVQIDRLFPQVGQSFYSSLRRPLLQFEEDRTPGVHDMLFAACDPARYAQYHVPGHASCAENFQAALRTLGASCALVPQPVNFFMNVAVRPDGSVAFGPPQTEAGDWVLLRAFLDCLIVLSACPQQWNPAANYHPSDLLARILTR